jgi:hypothetical protein
LEEGRAKSTSLKGVFGCLIKWHRCRFGKKEGKKERKKKGLEVSRGARQQAVSGLTTGVGRHETKENELLLLVGGH